MAGLLQDKVVIVAGAGGIGDVLAQVYAAAGASVVLGDLDEARAKAVAAEIEAAGGRATGTMLDGGDDASIGAIVALAVSTYGALHGFHANYAYFGDASTSMTGLDLDLDVHDEMVRINLRGYLLCARHAVPAMIESGGGSIVFTSSGEAHQSSGVRFTYGMVKAGIHSLMRNTAVRYGPKGIRANVIAPGLILHDKMKAQMPVAMQEHVRGMAAVKRRLGEPEDIAHMGAFLLSDDAGYVTGQVVAVDGGATMRP